MKKNKRSLYCSKINRMTTILLKKAMHMQKHFGIGSKAMKAGLKKQ